MTANVFSSLKVIDCASWIAGPAAATIRSTDTLTDRRRANASQGSHLTAGYITQTLAHEDSGASNPRPPHRRCNYEEPPE